MYIKDASGKTYEHFGGPRDPVATDPHESSQFFYDTSAVWRDDATGKRGVLFDSATKEIIKLSGPTADQIKNYLIRIERSMMLFNRHPIALWTGWKGPFIANGLNRIDVAFNSFAADGNLRPLAGISDVGLLTQKFAINQMHVAQRGEVFGASMLLGSYSGQGSSGIWLDINNFLLPTGDRLDQLSEDIASNYGAWESKFKDIEQALHASSEIAKQFGDVINAFSGKVRDMQYVLPLRNYANMIRGIANSILLPPVPSTSFNATVSTQDPLDWADDDSRLEHRTFEFVPFNTGAADIPFLQGAPVSMITRVLERVKHKLKSSAVSTAVLEQNLQSLLDCTDPSTQYGFDPSPYSKTVVIEDLVRYIETMYSGTRNKRRFEPSERLHVFSVDAGMNVIDYGNYENLWLNHVDPTGIRPSARRAMLSATTEDELVDAIIQSTTASILCALKMHLIHFSAALRPSEFAKITSMLQDKNSVAYKNFKSVLQETMGHIFEVKGHPLEHFEAKIMNFETSEAWFSSMLSLVYSACPLTVDNPRGLKRSSCSVKVLEDSYMYFHQEQPFLEAVAEHLAMILKDAMGFSFGHHDDYIEIIRDEAWKAIVTKGFRYESPPDARGLPGTSIVIEKGKIKSHSSVDDWGFEFGWDNDGNTTLTHFDESDKIPKTTTLFDENGQISWGLLYGVSNVIPRGGGYGDDAYYVLEDVYYAKKDGTKEFGLGFISGHDSKIEVIRRGTTKKVSTGTLANITTINFGNSAASGSPSQVYDDQIIGYAEPNDEQPVIDYAEQAGNLEPGETK